MLSYNNLSLYSIFLTKIVESKESHTSFSLNLSFSIDFQHNWVVIQLKITHDGTSTMNTDSTLFNQESHVQELKIMNEHMELIERKPCFHLQLTMAKKFEMNQPSNDFINGHDLVNTTPPLISVMTSYTLKAKFVITSFNVGGVQYVRSRNTH